MTRRGPRQAGSVVVARGLGLSRECGTFPEQGSNPVPCPGRRILNRWITGKPVSTLFLIACGSYVLLLVETMNCPSELYTFQLQPVEESLPAFPLQH